MTPGDETWEHWRVESFFSHARVVPVEGTYVLKTDIDGTSVSAPELVTPSEAFMLSRSLRQVMCQQRDQLVSALRDFPTDKCIIQVASQIVADITSSSLEGNPLSAKPVVDARTVLIEGVECVRCSFDPRTMDGLVRISPAAPCTTGSTPHWSSVCARSSRRCARRSCARSSRDCSLMR